jgi:hypothetical protein
MGVDTEKIAVLEAALAAYPPDDSAVRARLLANLGQELIFAGQGDRPQVLTATALTMARRLSDRATLAHTLLARGNATFSDLAWLAEFLAISAESVALAEELGDPYLRAIAEHQRFSAAFHAGLVEEADRALEATARAAEEAGQPILRWWVAIGLRRRRGPLCGCPGHARPDRGAGLAGPYQPRVGSDAHGPENSARQRPGADSPRSGARQCPSTRAGERGG